jgi:hypothetical protein
MVQAVALATHLWTMVRPHIPRAVSESLIAYWATAPLGHLLSRSGGKPLPLMPFGKAEPFLLCAVGLAAGLVLLAVASRRVRVVGVPSTNGGLAQQGKSVQR